MRCSCIQYRQKVQRILCSASAADLQSRKSQNAVTMQRCHFRTGVYATLKGILGKDMLFDCGNDASVLVEMLHSCTPSANKNDILKSFQSENGTIRLLIATIAFGMGIDCKGVHRIIHYGPSKNVEAYLQETGRAGGMDAKVLPMFCIMGSCSIMLMKTLNHL